MFCELGEGGGGGGHGLTVGATWKVTGLAHASSGFWICLVLVVLQLQVDELMPAGFKTMSIVWPLGVICRLLSVLVSVTSPDSLFSVQTPELSK